MRMFKICRIVPLGITFGLAILNAQNYDLKLPKGNYTLPPILREVSGITITDDDNVICIQDELGLLFKFNTETKTLAGRDSFYVEGDFEGIASVGEDLYVLRSDGAIIWIKKPFTDELTTQTYFTGIPAEDNEGLCYDKENNRLLIASKSMSTKANSSYNERMVYAFDLKEKKLSTEPLIVIDIRAIQNFLVKRYNISSTADVHFNPSEIAIHPITGKAYVLSADAHLLCVFENGVFESAEMLDKDLFYKAEGLSFLSNGDLLISNEGPKKGSGNILLFKMKK
jgi:hypothetical protein